MTVQPDHEALNVLRVYEKFLDLAAVGWVAARLEAQGRPLPGYDDLHRMADEWKANLAPDLQGDFMTAHSHTTFVDGCYRCDLSRDEAQRSQDWTALENVIALSMEKCRFPDEDLAIDAAEAVLDWARTREGREVLARALDLSWVEGTVDPHPTNPHIPRGKHNGVRWFARRLVGKWEEIPRQLTQETP
jgi:hypothetical protein